MRINSSPATGPVALVSVWIGWKYSTKLPVLIARCKRGSSLNACVVRMMMLSSHW